MIRGVNWSNDLVLWARDEIGKPYVWGETDCGSLVRRGVAVLYGSDVGTTPAYDSAIGALRAVRELGGVRGALEQLGAEVIGLKFATTGDIIVADPVFPEDALGITPLSLCLGPTVLTSDPDAGVVVTARPRDGAFLAFRLPYELTDG